MDKVALLIEADKRGILPPEKKALLDEARKRGLVPGVDFSAKEMAKNVPASGGKFLRDMVEPVIHPIETAKSLGNLAVGAAQKAIPGEQRKEKYADAVGKFVMDRYGSVDNFKTTLMDDPIGVLADASMLLTSGGTALARAPGQVGKVGKAVQTAGTAVDPVNFAVNTVEIAGKAVPKSVPRSLYESSAKWRTVISPKDRANMTETALREDLPPNEKGVGKMHAAMRELNDEIDALVDNAQGNIPADTVLRHLNDLRTNLGGYKLNARRDMAAIDDFEQAFRDYLTTEGITDVTPRQLHDFKKDAWKQANFEIEQGSASYAKNEISKATGRAAREGVEAVSPEVAELNKRLADLMQLQPELERTVGRINNKNQIGVMEPALIGSSAVVGGTEGAVAGGIMAAMNRKSGQIAVYLEKLRKQKVPENYIQNRVLPSMLREAAVELGRLNQSINEPDKRKINKQPDGK